MISIFGATVSDAVFSLVLEPLGPGQQVVQVFHVEPSDPELGLVDVVAVDHRHDLSHARVFSILLLHDLRRRRRKRSGRD